MLPKLERVPRHWRRNRSRPLSNTLPAGTICTWASALHLADLETTPTQFMLHITLITCIISSSQSSYTAQLKFTKQSESTAFQEGSFDKNEKPVDEKPLFYRKAPVASFMRLSWELMLLRPTDICRLTESVFNSLLLDFRITLARCFIASAYSPAVKRNVTSSCRTSSVVKSSRKYIQCDCGRREGRDGA